MMINTGRYATSLILILAAICSCGYRLSGAKVALPEGVGSIHVAPFENRTLEPDVGVVVAEAVQREILRRKMVKLVSPKKADAVLRGTVEVVTLASQAYDAEGFTTAYRVRMVVSARLERGGETVWRRDGIVKEEEIAVGGLIMDNYVRRARALAAISEDVAEQIHIAMVEGW